MKDPKGIIGLCGGHHSKDTGVVVNDVEERMLNMLIASSVARVLGRLGYYVVFASGTIGRKVQTLNAADVDVCVDIHFNAAGPSAKGAEVLYYNSGKELAKCVYSRMLEVPGISTGKGAIRDSDIKIRDAQGNLVGRSLGFLRKTKAPAIIVEPAFLTNSSEYDLCLNPTFQDRLAKAIAIGIIDYVKTGV